MKKKLLMILALICCMGMALPAFAVEMDYGGYWRTRAYTMDGFTGDAEDKSMDLSQVDTRGRLRTQHYINDELSWSNQVEFNVIWGDEENGGGISTDGTDYLRFKHSYVDLDATVAEKDLHFRIGLQPFTAAKGMLFNDDFAGLKFSYEMDNTTLNLVWMKVFEGATLSGEYEEDLDDLDVDFVGLAPQFNLMDDALTINAYAFYLFSDDSREWSATTGNTDLSVYYMGADFDYRFSAGNIWGVLMYEGGSAEVVYSEVEYDVSAYIAALGGAIEFDNFDIHSQVFYASGDDDFMDSDIEGFGVPRGQSYYWSEIMGLGVMDSYSVNGSPNDTPSNIIAGNIGVKIDATEDLEIMCDIWHAQYAETNQWLKEDKLGTEFDLRMDYKVNDDFLVILTGAYLLANDAVTVDAEDDTDVFEIGMQVSLSFNSGY